MPPCSCACAPLCEGADQLLKARLARKGNALEAKLYYSENVLMENRNGLIVEVELLEVTGFAEREAGLDLLRRQRRRGRRGRRLTVAEDRGYE
jgi:hypothetical protein